VAIARALINEPPMLLADEPTGNLDSAAGDSIMNLLAALHRHGRTIVLVTHDEHVASFADRELLLRDGALASDRALAGPTS
jgi:putative ABC transport system ATP-binding protein